MHHKVTYSASYALFMTEVLGAVLNYSTLPDKPPSSGRAEAHAHRSATSGLLANKPLHIRAKEVGQRTAPYVSRDGAGPQGPRIEPAILYWTMYIFISLILSVQ